MLEDLIGAGRLMSAKGPGYVGRLYNVKGRVVVLQWILLNGRNGARSLRFL